MARRNVVQVVLGTAALALVGYLAVLVGTTGSDDESSIPTTRATTRPSTTASTRLTTTTLSIQARVGTIGDPCPDEGATFPAVNPSAYPGASLAVPYGNRGGICSGGSWKWIIPTDQGAGCSMTEPAARLGAAATPEGAPLVCAQVGVDHKWVVPGQPLTQFYDGTYVVGAETGQVSPGTYSITNGPVEDCYWERVDGDGQTIDNDFVTGAPTVRVTIASGDAGFTARGCGHWELGQ